MQINSLKQVDLRLERGLGSGLGPSLSPGDRDNVFPEALERARLAVVEPHQAAAAAVNRFAGGENSIHETLIAVEKADISLKYMMNIRNKLLDAYREVMQMGA